MHMSIPMVRLHNSGKFSCGTPFQFQCASWFSQSHHWGCVSNEDVTSQLSEGSGLARWLFDISWGWMGWFVTNYSYTYTLDGTLPFWSGCSGCCAGTACCGCNTPLYCCASRIRRLFSTERILVKWAVWHLVSFSFDYRYISPSLYFDFTLGHR